MASFCRVVDIGVSYGGIIDSCTFHVYISNREPFKLTPKRLVTEFSQKARLMVTE
jgi:hypothetical protein